MEAEMTGAFIRDLSGATTLPSRPSFAGATLRCDKFRHRPHWFAGTQRCVLAAKAALPHPDKERIPVSGAECTPGGIHPTLKAEVLSDLDFRTGGICDNATTAQESAQTYHWHGISHLANNEGVMQTCELDHFISPELGGAYTVDNIWPQCGPPGPVLRARCFKERHR